MGFGFLDVYVAHFGHPQLLGAKHWAIVVMTEPKILHGVAYQVTGSTLTYSVKQPESIKLLETQEYLGRVLVGKVHQDWVSGPESTSLSTILQDTPVDKGNLRWNCQNWVVDGLQRLRDADHPITGYSLEELQLALSAVHQKDHTH
ncbi:hypothetical protein BD779DRAFT_1785431 [Infundibulicybe gibba]|nr:hypothetical protein BD779DRAFT_1785431 [Infundibulicybe gibba]